MYFVAPDGLEIRNSAGKIGPLIDVRAAGGYVLAVGSVIDERAYPGNPECRALVKGGRAYEAIDDTEPAPLPAWLAALARPAEHGPQVPSQIRASGTPSARLRGLTDLVSADPSLVTALGHWCGLHTGSGRWQPPGKPTPRP